MKAAAHIAIVSQVWRGHVPAYHGAYVEAFKRCGCRISEIGVAEGGNATALHGNPRPVRPLVRRVLERIGVLDAVRGYRWWNWAAGRLRRAEAACATRIDGAFFVYLDGYFLGRAVAPSWVDRRFPWPWSGIVAHPLAAEGVRGAFPQGERVLAAARCRAVLVVDDGFVEFGRRAWPGKVVIEAPELANVSAPAAETPLVREIRTWGRGRRIVSLLGVLSRKKNVGAFIELARRSELAGDPLAFVIAGELSLDASGRDDYREISELLRGIPSNCRCWPDKIADGEEFNALVMASDLLFLAYRPEPAKSNVLTKAAFFRRPVLVSEGHMMALAVRRHRLGEAVAAADIDMMYGVLLRILSEDDSKRDYEGFYIRNSEQRLNETVPRVLEAIGR